MTSCAPCPFFLKLYVQRNTGWTRRTRRHARSEDGGGGVDDEGTDAEEDVITSERVSSYDNRHACVESTTRAKNPPLEAADGELQRRISPAPPCPATATTTNNNRYRHRRRRDSSKTFSVTIVLRTVCKTLIFVYFHWFLFRFLMPFFSPIV